MQVNYNPSVNKVKPQFKANLQQALNDDALSL